MDFSAEESSDEDGDSSSSTKSQLTTNDAYSQPPQAIYVALLLLCVICVLLVAVIIGMVWGFHSVVLLKNHRSKANGILQRKYETQNNHSSHSVEHHPACSTFDDLDGTSINGSVLEIRDTDTAPIVSVTFKK